MFMLVSSRYERACATECSAPLVVLLPEPRALADRVSSCLGRRIIGITEVMIRSISCFMRIASVRASHDLLRKSKIALPVIRAPTTKINVAR